MGWEQSDEGSSYKVKKFASPLRRILDIVCTSVSAEESSKNLEVRKISFEL